MLKFSPSKISEECASKMEKGEERGGKEKSGLVLLKSLFCGGMAGMASKSFVAPLDRVKILLQTQNSAYKNKGVVSALGIQYTT